MTEQNRILPLLPRAAEAKPPLRKGMPVVIALVAILASYARWERVAYCYPLGLAALGMPDVWSPGWASSPAHSRSWRW